MLIIPAIDLKDGKCVRLRQGEMDRETKYSDDPPAMALHWQTLGAKYLHVVDLNGAVEGHPKNLEHIEAIVKCLSIPIQVGGGIRSLETIRRYLTIGVGRVVLGTAALQDAVLIAKASEEFPSKILVGIDVREGSVAIQGWTNLSTLSPDRVLQALSAFPLAGIIFTDIHRDGMLTGPNLSAIQDIVSLSPFPVIASGGVTQIGDIQALKQLGSRISGVIIGKALYEGTIDLPTAIRTADLP